MPSFSLSLPCTISYPPYCSARGVMRIHTSGLRSLSTTEVKAEAQAFSIWRRSSSLPSSPGSSRSSFAIMGANSRSASFVKRIFWPRNSTCGSVVQS